MIQVRWVKCEGGVWCNLERVDLAGAQTAGVYVIWQAGTPSRAVRVGQGEIADRLAAHRRDPAILEYAPLFVTWAELPRSQRDGVERFLANKWNPLVGDAFPDAAPIAVNLPA